MPDIVSGSRHIVPVFRDSCQSSVYDILLKFENLSVIVTGRKRILLVTHEMVRDSDRWLSVISCTDLDYPLHHNFYYRSDNEYIDMLTASERSRAFWGFSKCKHMILYSFLLKLNKDNPSNEYLKSFTHLETIKRNYKKFSNSCKVVSLFRSCNM